jgi:ATP-binding cassette subfamily A (ABC1) protein 3
MLVVDGFLYIFILIGISKYKNGFQIFTKKSIHEEIQKNMKASIEIKNLTKIFDRNEICMNLELFENEITILLGENGCGKTTTMSMLCGLLKPSNGTAFIYKNDLVKNSSELKSLIGVCMQSNVLFDRLTVFENLKFFCILKGLKKNKIATEIENFVQKTNLNPNEFAGNLSGGQQRKLCLLIALCGNSKFILLDEVSSGIDPNSRRDLWNLLQAEKMGRTILLTTHFIHEAEALGDQIAIMKSGKLIATGNSFDLKKKFSSDYNLICVKNHSQDKQNYKIIKMVREILPNVKLSSEIGMEMKFEFKNKEIGKLKEVCRKLEENCDELGLNGFGISTSTLEDVLVR